MKRVTENDIKQHPRGLGFGLSLDVLYTLFSSFNTSKVVEYRIVPIEGNKLKVTIVHSSSITVTFEFVLTSYKATSVSEKATSVPGKATSVPGKATSVQFLF